MEKNELKAAMEMSKNSAEKRSLVGAETMAKHSINFNEVIII